MSTEVVVKESKNKKDFMELLDAGYPFGDLKELQNESKSNALLTRLFRFLSGEEKKIFVAYARSEGKAVGKITVKKITRNLWFSDNMFVSPNYRGRGIAPLLYKVSFEYLQSIGIKKVAGSVATDNLPSVKSIEKTWDGFLSRKVYFYSGTVPHAVINKSSGVVIRVYSGDDRKDLFELYKVCCNEDWYSFLEINEKNFLDRFIDSISPRGLLSLLVRKKILIAEEGKVAKAYVIIVGNRFRQRARVFFLFLPQRVSPYVAESLITDALNDPFINGATQLTIYSVVTNDAPLDQILPEIASKRQIHMIPKKNIRLIMV